MPSFGVIGCTHPVTWLFLLSHDLVLLLFSRLTFFLPLIIGSLQALPRGLIRIWLHICWMIQHSGLPLGPILLFREPEITFWWESKRKRPLLRLLASNLAMFSFISCNHHSFWNWLPLVAITHACLLCLKSSCIVIPVHSTVLWFPDWAFSDCHMPS